MRSYCLVYVDAGYLLASAATRVTGTSLRGGVTIQYRELIEAIIAQAEADSGLPLLRVNWYDAAGGLRGGPDATQDAIGMLPRTKLRLGRMSPGGEQKGVDLRIGLDLATHARNHVADIVYLVSGDDDLTEAVEEAQGHGVQVLVMAAPSQLGLAHSVSRNLQREADGLVVIDPVTIDHTVKQRRGPVGGEVDAAPEAAAAADRSRMPPSAVGAQGAVLGASGVDSAGAAGSAGADGPAATAARGVAAGSLVTEASSLAKGGKATDPGTPTPKVMPGRTIFPGRPEPAARGGAGVPARAAVVYSSATGGETVNHFEVQPEVQDLIDEVVRSVIDTWRRTASEQEIRAIEADRPYIPRDLDRALLIDLSSRLGVYDIDEAQRHVLRQRFWTAFGS